MPNNIQAQGKQLLEALSSLTQKGGQSLGKTAKASPALKGLELLGQLVGQVGTEMGKASVDTPAQAEQKMLKGTQTPMTQQEENPLTKATTDEVIKVRKEQVREAAEQGMPLEQILSMSNQTQHQQQEQTIQQPKQSPVQQPQIPDAPSLFGGLLKQHPATSGRVLENLITEQQIRGEQPLQVGDKQKIGLELISKAALENSGGKALSADAVKNLANATQGIEQLDSLMESFTINKDLFKTWGGPGDTTGQQVKVVRKNLADIIGRLRSGGAINDEELKTFMSFVPKQGFVKGRTEANETVQFKMKTMHRLFSDIANGLRTPSQSSAMVTKIQSALKQGHSPEEISKKLGF